MDASASTFAQGARIQRGENPDPTLLGRLRVVTDMPHWHAREFSLGRASWRDEKRSCRTWVLDELQGLLPLDHDGCVPR